MKIRLLITAILTAMALNCTEASVRTSPQDSIIYTRTMQELLPYAGLPAGELMVKTAGMFYGTPYKSGTLETVPETLTVNLHETDCILLVETCTAMTLLLKECTDGGIPSFEDLPRRHHGRLPLPPALHLRMAPAGPGQRISEGGNSGARRHTPEPGILLHVLPSGQLSPPAGG